MIVDGTISLEGDLCGSDSWSAERRARGLYVIGTVKRASSLVVMGSGRGSNVVQENREAEKYLRDDCKQHPTGALGLWCRWGARA